MGWNNFLFRTEKESWSFSDTPLDYCVYLYKSYPAERAEPRVGNFALSDRRLTRRFEIGKEDVCKSADRAELTDILLFLSRGVSDMEDGEQE